MTSSPTTLDDSSHHSVFLKIGVERQFGQVAFKRGKMGRRGKCRKPDRGGEGSVSIDSCSLLGCVDGWLVGCVCGYT